MIIEEYEDVVNISPAEIYKRNTIIREHIKGCVKNKTLNYLKCKKK